MQIVRNTSARTSSCPARHGTSLVEMMVVMTVMAAVLSVGLTSLFRMFQLQSRELQSLSEMTVWRRLSRDFRDDAHLAENAVAAAPNLLELQTADGLVSWSVEGDTLKRTAQPTPDSENGAQSMEQYRIPDATFGLACTPPQDSEPGIVTVVIERTGIPHTRPTSGRIEAVAGLTLLHSKRASTGGTP